MAQLIIRLRAVVRSLGNEGALANVRSDMASAAEVCRVIDQLEARMLVATPARAPRAA